VAPAAERLAVIGRFTAIKVAKVTLIAVEIVRKNPDQVGFAANPRRWVVERFFAWIRRNRRLAKDFEATIDSARAVLYVAFVILLARLIARASCFRRTASPICPDLIYDRHSDESAPCGAFEA
jgi:putative transposase